MTTPTMIETRLAPLIGLPLWAITRACTLESFQFGPRKTVTQEIGPRAGLQKEVGSHALHVLCAWRISGPSGVMVDSRDRYEIVDDGENWDRPEANRCDRRVQYFIVNACPCNVIAVRADTVGSLRIELEREYVLEVFPDASTDEQQWRFFSPYESTPHAVFAKGVQTDA
jgi:hypothetical protein